MVNNDNSVWYRAKQMNDALLMLNIDHKNFRLIQSVPNFIFSLFTGFFSYYSMDN